MSKERNCILVLSSDMTNKIPA